MIIEKIISGGQTGADIAGLKAAKACGIPTGGYMTKGCRTLDGPRLEYVAEYDMIEMDKISYRDRTRENVKQSDGTICFAESWESLGEKCTKTACRDYDKPRYEVDVRRIHDELFLGKGPILVHEWLDRNSVKILNIAGNSERTCPGIEVIIYLFLVELFKVTNAINI